MLRNHPGRKPESEPTFRQTPAAAVVFAQAIPTMHLSVTVANSQSWTPPRIKCEMFPAALAMAIARSTTGRADRDTSRTQSAPSRQEYFGSKSIAPIDQKAEDAAATE